MRGLWSTLAMVVVLAGLVGYIYFVDSKSEPGAAATKEKVFGGTLSTTDIEEVQIKLASGESSRVQKTDGLGGSWSGPAPATEEKLTSITSSRASSRQGCSPRTPAT